MKHARSLRRRYLVCLLLIGVSLSAGCSRPSSPPPPPPKPPAPKPDAALASPRATVSNFLAAVRRKDYTGLFYYLKGHPKGDVAFHGRDLLFTNISWSFEVQEVTESGQEAQVTVRSIGATRTSSHDVDTTDTYCLVYDQGEWVIDPVQTDAANLGKDTPVVIAALRRNFVSVEQLPTSKSGRSKMGSRRAQ